MNKIHESIKEFVKDFTKPLTDFITTPFVKDKDDEDDEYDEYDLEKQCYWVVGGLKCFIERYASYIATLTACDPKDFKKYAKHIIWVAVSDLNDDGMNMNLINAIISTLAFADVSMIKAIFEDKSVQAIIDADTNKGIIHDRSNVSDAYDAKVIKAGEAIINAVITTLDIKKVLTSHIQ